MGRKRYTVEQIIHKLREAEVELSQGKAVGHVVRKLGIQSRRITGGAGNTVA